VDVGGTLIKAVVVAGDGQVIRRARIPTAAHEGGGSVLARLAEFGANLIGQARELDECLPAAFGVAVPGVVDEAAGVARFAANIGWRDAPIAGLLGQRLGVPVAVCHDVRAAALAEARLGAARREGDFLFVAIGTGIAAALVLGGQPYPGAHTLSGELGHVTVTPGGTRCGCGATGCLETVASAAAITRRYRELSGGRAVAGAADVARLVMTRDLVAQQVWAEAVTALSAALAWCQSVLDPEFMVIGGGLSRAGRVLLDPLARELADRLTFQRMPQLAVSTLGDEAGCAGAALAARFAAGLAPLPGFTPDPG
jgi:glucokinase